MFSIFYQSKCCVQMPTVLGYHAKHRIEIDLRFEVHTAVRIKFFVFCDETMCDTLDGTVAPEELLLPLSGSFLLP
jgi:hypothetical protein